MNHLLTDIQGIYDRHPSGCCLHSVLDDANLDDHSVEWCRTYATKRGHQDCELLAMNIANLSLEDREILLERFVGYHCAVKQYRKDA